MHAVVLQWPQCHVNDQVVIALAVSCLTCSSCILQITCRQGHITSMGSRSIPRMQRNSLCYTFSDMAACPQPSRLGSMLSCPFHCPLASLQ
jgi:hypothetical protein